MEARVIKYYDTAIVRDSKDPSDKLVAAVKRAIREGWQPFGGVSVVFNDGYCYLAQAIVQYAD